MLVQSCLRGDREAFDELVDRYEGPLFNASYRITGSVEDAMDATQNAFVNAFEKLHTFDQSLRFFSWIYRIAINQALNLVGRRKPTADLDDNTPTAAPNPETAYRETEASNALVHAMVELAADYRTVIHLKHLEGFSYKEIAVLLEIPEKTVKSRLFTARRQLRLILTEQGFAP